MCQVSRLPKFFSTSFSSCLLVTRVLLHSTKSTQEWALLQQREGRGSPSLLTAQMAFRAMPTLPSLPQRSQTSPSPCSAACGKGMKTREKGDTSVGSPHCWAWGQPVDSGLLLKWQQQVHTKWHISKQSNPLSLFLGKGQWRLGTQAAGWYRGEAWLQPPVFPAGERELPAHSYNSSVV